MSTSTWMTSGQDLLNITGGVQQPAPPATAPTTSLSTSGSTPWYDSLGSITTSLANTAASIYDVVNAPKGTTYIPSASGPVPVQQQTITSATWLPWLLIGGALIAVVMIADHRRK